MVEGLERYIKEAMDDGSLNPSWYFPPSLIASLLIFFFVPSWYHSPFMVSLS
jgi:hypothetical protein